MQVDTVHLTHQYPMKIKSGTDCEVQLLVPLENTTFGNHESELSTLFCACPATNTWTFECHCCVCACVRARMCA